jgi:hypothetical protein
MAGGAPAAILAEMHPYRDPPVIAEPVERRSPEELILYGLLVAIGAIPVVLTLASGASFDVNATLGLLMICSGALGAIAYAHRNRGSRAR